MEVAIHADAAGHKIPGGIGVYTSRLIEHLAARGDGNSYTLLASKDARLEAPVGMKVSRSGLGVRALYASWNFLRLPAAGAYDVVHATGFVIPAAKGASVATVHDLTVELHPHLVPTGWRQVYAKGLRIAVERAEVIITDCEAIKRQLCEAHRVEPGRVVAIPLAPNVTPSDLGQTTPADDGPPYILSVGTLDPRKNQAGLVDAFDAAADELAGWELVLAGVKGWGAEATEQAIARSRVGARVRLIDSPDAQQLARLYAGASAAAFPALYEGFGLGSVEAMSFGIPTLISTDPALVEVAGDAALHADAADIAQLAAGLVKVATDETLRRRLSDDGRARAAGLTWELTASRTVEAYERAAR